MGNLQFENDGNGNDEVNDVIWFNLDECELVQCICPLGGCGGVEIAMPCAWLHT